MSPHRVALIGLGCLALVADVWRWSARAPPASAVPPGSPPASAVLSAAPVRRGTLSLSGRVTHGGAAVAGATVTATVPSPERLGDLACGCEDGCGLRALACPCQHASDVLQQALEAGRAEAVPVARATTANDGTFTLRGLEEGTVTVEVRRAGPPAQSASVVLELDRDRRNDVHIELADVLSISGSLVSATGEPVAHARVFATGVLNGSGSAETDARGGFEVGALSPGAWTLTATSQGAIAHGTAQAGERDVKLQLSEVGSMHGRVADRSQAPVTRFMVDHQGFVSASGEFEQPLAHTGRVCVSAEGYVPVCKTATLNGVARIELGTFTLGEGGDLAVHVNDRAGRALAGAQLWSGTKRTQALATTTADGTAVLHGFAGTASLTVVREGYVKKDVQVADGDRELIVTLQAGATLTVRLRTAAGRAATGGVVAATALGTGSDLGDVQLADADGATTLSTLAPGRWQIVGTTRSATDAPKVAEVVELAEGEVRALELTLPVATVTLEVQAVLPPGAWTGGGASLLPGGLAEPRSDAELADTVPEALAETSMDPDHPGRFSFGAVSPGRYWLVVQLTRDWLDVQARWAAALEVSSAPRQVVRLPAPGAMISAP